jgi:hypothetical protein
MSGFLWGITRVFDVLFYPFRNLSPWVSLAVFSGLAGILMLLVFRFTSNQAAIRRVKDRMQAHLLEVRLFSEQLSVVFKAYGRILRWSGAYLGHTLLPLAVMTVPLAILLIQMDFRFGHEALHTQDQFLVKVLAAGNAPIEEATLRVPDGLTLTAPALHIVHEPDIRQEVNWRLEAQRPGNYVVEVMLGNQTFSKQVVVADSANPLRVSPARVRPDWLELLLESSEPPLPTDSPIHHILVVYPHRSIQLWRWELHWLVPFFVITLIAAFALKGIFRTEF